MPTSGPSVPLHEEAGGGVGIIGGAGYAGLPLGLRFAANAGTFASSDRGRSRLRRRRRPATTTVEPDESQRFPLIAVVPVTGTAGEGALYPELAAGASGLTKRSYALVDHLRSIDKQRIRRVFGRVALSELEAIDQSLELLLGLIEES